MKNRLLLLTGLVLLLSWLGLGAAQAQTRAINGRVQASDGGPLPGATVLEVGTSNGVTTGADGSYELTVQPRSSVAFSSIGYATQTVVVGDQTSISVTLKASATDLGEAIVVGYGTQAKADLTGSLATVSSKEITNVPVLTFEQAIQGKATGVFIENGGGKLGGATKVRIRGTSSISGDNQPLYVVDGIPIVSEDQSDDDSATNPLTDINPNDIQNVTILKDASASAIYGSRASNGVILITTKRGKTGNTRFDIGYQFGLSKPTHLRKFLNSTDYLALEREAAANENLRDPSFDYVAYTERVLKRYAAGTNAYQDASIDTDWQKAILQRAPTNQYSVAASGGDERTRFYISGNYIKQDGIIRNNSFERMSARVNVDHKATSRLTIGLNLNLSRSVNRRVDNDNSFGTPFQAVALSPITPTIDPRTGQTSGAYDPATGQPNQAYPVYYNPVLSIENVTNIATVYRTLGNVFGVLDLGKGLSFRSELGTDLLFQFGDYKAGLLTARNTGFAANGQGQSTNTVNTRFTTNNYFTYRPSLGEAHNLEIVAGTSFEQRRIDFGYVTVQQFPSDKNRLPVGGAVISGGSGQRTASALNSYFARVNYAFSERYLLTLSGRLDGSSRFSHRYGFFPAASVGWIVTQEEFLKDNAVLSFLKPRFSIGQTGNQGFTDFGYLAQYAAGAYGGQATQAPINIANPNLKWETTTQSDLGLDYGFLGGRISGEFDAYVKNTKNLALVTNVPGTTGFTTYFQNIGDLQNKGLEFSLTTQNVVGKFGWTTSFNAAINRNKVTSLAGVSPINGGIVNRAMEGQPIGVFYTVEYAGVDSRNGNALYYLNTTNPDGTLNHDTTSNYNAAQRVVVGNPNPKWTGGVTNTLTYAGFELNFTFQGVFGNQIYNAAGGYMSANASSGFDNQTTDQLARWQKPGDITNVPQARLFENNGTGNSSRYISNGDYVRLKTTTFSYTFNKSLLAAAHLSSARIFLTGVNLLTFTKYKGADPEVNSDYTAGNIGQGNDFYSTPQLRTYTVGVTLGL